jgi:hypothetical protein
MRQFLFLFQSAILIAVYAKPFETPSLFILFPLK